MTRDSTLPRWQTRYSLLARAKDGTDGEAWKELLGIYQQFVVNLLSRFGVAVSAREDLVQEVIIKMWQGLENYDQERARFRTWLRAVTRNTAMTYFRQCGRKRGESVDAEQAIRRIEGLSNPDLDALIEQEWKAHLSQLAFQRVQAVFSGKAIDVFLMSMNGVEAAEIAQRHRLSVDSVYTLRNRVKSLMIREVRNLIDTLEF